MPKQRGKGKSQKLFRFDVDQSVRMEELNRDTILAVANKDHSFSLKIPIRVKRQLHDQFRRLGKIRQFAPQIFKAALIVCLEHLKYQVHELAIDLEYPGYEKRLLADLKEYFPYIAAHIVLIGRKSPAHRVAYDVHASKRKADKIAMTRELLHAGRNQTIRSPRGPSKKKHTKKR